MKKILLLITLVISIFNSYSQPIARPAIALIPQPFLLVQDNGVFTLPADVSVIISKNEEVKKIAQQFSKQLSTATGYKINIKDGNTPALNSISLSLTTDKTIPDEGYRLKINKTGVNLFARTPAGIFYGIQTLLQLLPAEITSNTSNKSKKWSMPF
ncbi:MAG: glycoside hydrolase family 20 zincin-like fold domain-containing protein, partial [Chitinophagaceae bacterium]